VPPLTFTPKWVRRVSAEGKRRQFADSVQPGLVLRVSPSGAKSYAVVYHKDGRNYRVTLGRPSEEYSLSHARAHAKAILLEVQLGKNPAVEKRQGRDRAELPVGELVEKMLEAVARRASTDREWRRLAAVELKPLLRRPASEVTRADVRLWLGKIARRSSSTAKHSLEVLRRAYTWGMDMELVAGSPCAGVTPPRIEASERVLSTPEVRAVWRALEVLGEGVFPDFVRLALLTAARRGSVLGARAQEFEGLGKEGQDLYSPVKISQDGIKADEVFCRWTIPASRSKSGRAHVVPLSPQALVVVRRRIAAARGGYLFPTFYVRRAGQEASPHLLALPSAWVRTLKAATIWQLRRELGPGRRAAMAPWKLHGLRHTIATHLTEDLGVDHYLVSLILGHAVGGPAVSRVYNRAERLAERRAALIAWGSWVESVAAGGGARVLPMRRS
jgi:integrase